MALASTWEEVELPLLQEIGTAELEDREPQIHEFFEERAISSARAALVVDRLREDNLIDGVFSKSFGRPGLRMMANVRLTADGARAAGMWPSGDPAAAFIAALEAAMTRAETEEHRTRLGAVIHALQAVPANVLTQILVQAAVRHGAVP